MTQNDYIYINIIRGGNNYNYNNAVLVARGGGESQIPAINPRALRDGRKGDPLHKCCGKKCKIKSMKTRENKTVNI